MELLIIGNGFDLAHGLPTRYADFLKYRRDYDETNPVSSSSELNEEFITIIRDNVWIDYFLKSTKDLDNPRTWIDFEKEIAEIIQNIDLEYIKEELDTELTHKFTPNSYSNKANIFSLTFCEFVKKLEVSHSLIDLIFHQLRYFTRAFEIYCQKINETLTESIITSERKELIDKAKDKADSYNTKLRKPTSYSYRTSDVGRDEQLRKDASAELSYLLSGIKPIDYLSMSKFDCVLSFNYTNTYERLYGNDKTKYCYIHGKAQNDKNKTNMIFGIDDDLPQGEESNNFKWVRFKKYYQRIIYRTGSEYKDWLSSLINQSSNQNYVHIIGHSLDRTDYDVLYEIFSNQSFKIIVYYYCPEDFEDKVQKVIKLLAYKGINGRDELIRRVHGSQWSIKFVDQYNETDGLFIK